MMSLLSWRRSAALAKRNQQRQEKAEAFSAPRNSNWSVVDLLQLSLQSTIGHCKRGFPPARRITRCGIAPSPACADVQAHQCVHARSWRRDIRNDQTMPTLLDGLPVQLSGSETYLTASLITLFPRSLSLEALNSLLQSVVSWRIRGLHT